MCRYLRKFCRVILVMVAIGVELSDSVHRKGKFSHHLFSRTLKHLKKAFYIKKKKHISFVILWRCALALPHRWLEYVEKLL